MGAPVWSYSLRSRICSPWRWVCSLMCLSDYRWPGTVSALTVLCSLHSDTKITLLSPSQHAAHLYFTSNQPHKNKRKLFSQPISPPFALFHGINWQVGAATNTDHSTTLFSSLHSNSKNQKAMAHKGLINFLYWLKCKTQGASQLLSHTTSNEKHSNEIKEIMKSKARDQYATFLKDCAQL